MTGKLRLPGICSSLFLAHPEGLTKEQVGLYFWPDATPDELKLRFKNTLYRLRRAVGRQSVFIAG